MRSTLFVSPVLALALALSAAAACSSTPTTEEPVVTATASATSDVDGPDTQPTAQPTSQPTSKPPAKAAWKDLTFDQKMEVMKSEVMPQMKPKFQEADAKEFAKFDCATCHGKAAKTGKFTMPNADLPKLNAADNFAAHSKSDHDKKMLNFMFTMTPQLASILNAAPWDPNTKQGFGCFSCHTAKK